MSISQATKTAQRCALIWFSISSADVYQALMEDDFDRLRRLGLKIDREAFGDISSLLKEKADFREGMQAMRTMWLIQCSPPPCLFSRYESVLQLLEEDIGSEKAAR